MRVLLDTQVLYFAATDPAALPKKVLRLLEDGETERLISAASIMEIAVKHSIGKLDFDEFAAWQTMRDLIVNAIAFEPRHALRMFSLPLHHRDPFDRMIIATALTEDIPLIGADRQFRKYKGLKVIWQ